VPVAFVLAASMLGIQFCIGAVNDLFDERLDALSKPRKPIPAGLVTRRLAWAAAIATGGAGMTLAFVGRGPDVVLLAMAAAMLGAGLVYDAWLKRTAFAWVCFAVAFPILPVFAWYGATGTIPPPRAELLLPLAALAGPALHIANGLVDYETDAAAGVRNLPILLGRPVAIFVMAALTVVIHGLAWATISGSSGVAALSVLVSASSLATVGIGLSSRSGVSDRRVGWTAQAGSIALLGFGWLLAVAA
jgi:4-hydroxybenzoate polyprenyltransferase